MILKFTTPEKAMLTMCSKVLRELVFPSAAPIQNPVSGR